MNSKQKNNGSVMLMTVFLIAMLSAVVIGIMQINAEEIQLSRNHICAAKALCIAEAGLNDALAQIRNDSQWDDGFTDKAFAQGQYSVDVNDSTISSIGTSSEGFVARIEADITVGVTSPYVIRIDNLRINE